MKYSRLNQKTKSLAMIHNEHFRTAGESYEVRHDGNGTAIHVYIKDGEAIVFPSMQALIDHTVLGVADVERFYIQESLLSDLYTSPMYDYYTLKSIAANTFPRLTDEA